MIVKAISKTKYLLTIILVCNIIPTSDTNTPYNKEGVGPRIVIFPNEPIFYIDAQSPSNKALICRTAGESSDLFTQLKWTGPNRADNWDELRKRHSVTEWEPNSNRWLLKFKNPSTDDAGTYYCHGSLQGSDVYNASVIVKVTSPIKLDYCPDRRYLVHGSRTSKITCRITADSLQVTIYKDNILITQFDNRYKWDYDNDGIVINGEVNMSDAGRYLVRVVSELTGEHKEQYITVDVHTRPEIAPFNTSFQVIEGESAELVCKTSGTPQPVVYWFDPQLRNLSSIGGYFVNPERGTLLINKVDRKFDNGTFKCIADNSVESKAERNVTVVVLVRPQIVKFENKTVDEKAEVTFECRASGHPVPDFSIRKQGLNSTSYRLGDGFVKDISLMPEDGGSDVWVYQVKIIAYRANFGLHYCNATNRAGTAERIGSLAVYYPPDLSQTPPEQYVRIGKKMTVTCHIKAYPAPIVTWTVDNTQIINPDQSSIKTSADGQTHIVTMMPPPQVMSGKFVCKAKNLMGDAEQTIIPRYTSVPGMVVPSLHETKPTTVKLLLSVPNDGGDRIKQFKYSARGISLDLHNPYFNYRDDKHNVSYIDASPNPTSIYTIKNLLPYYAYRITISAMNDVGEGDPTEISVETSLATRPDPPTIIRPTIAQQVGVPSDYSNGYLLEWSPPELDNGDPVTAYIIKYTKVAANASETPISVGRQRVINQMSERPLHARLGPLDVNSRYKFQVQAMNKYGESDPASIIVFTTADRPPMPEIESLTLAWLVEPSTSTLVALLGLAVFLLIIIDLLFCFCCQIGVIYFLRSWCCPAETNSVISDKTYT